MCKVADSTKFLASRAWPHICKVLVSWYLLMVAIELVNGEGAVRPLWTVGCYRSAIAPRPASSNSDAAALMLIASRLPNVSGN